ncbi:hypothetical protein F4861DRAFT_491226 [Xylaria intraflava]|nr:hypothetical protein F4861DRAFT_491226 [Xylaria intraflava]
MTGRQSVPSTDDRPWPFIPQSISRCSFDGEEIYPRLQIPHDEHQQHTTVAPDRDDSEFRVEDFSDCSSIESETEEGYLWSERSYDMGETDDLLIQHRSQTYTVCFPISSIADGTLTVSDVHYYASAVIEKGYSDDRLLVYNGQLLQEMDTPIRDYGVRNHSELRLVDEAISSSGVPSSDEYEDEDEDEIITEDAESPLPAPTAFHSRLDYITRQDDTQSPSPLQRAMGMATSSGHLELTTISRDNTADESLRRSASFAYLGAKLTRKLPDLSRANPFSGDGESSEAKRIKLSG